MLGLQAAASDARGTAKKLKDQESTLLTYKLEGTHGCNRRPFPAEAEVAAGPPPASGLPFPGSPRGR